MAIYRFKVSFEDYDDVTREIDIKSNQTFEELHRAIHASTGYPVAASSSFYVSNDFWIKGEEIAFLPNPRKVERGVALMENTKLSKFIDDPHQKFYYTYNFDRPFDFHVELMKIMLEEDEQKIYPCLFKSSGQAPKIPGSVVLPVSGAATEKIMDDFDFLNDEEFDPENLEKVDHLDDMSIDTPSEKGSEAQEVEEEDQEEDEFMDEFSDNENYDADDYQKDDY
jgi:hypothetical protein